MKTKKREYDVPTKEDYLLPGGHPETPVYFVDRYNNIYPKIDWGQLEAEYIQRDLDEHNKNLLQMELFI